MCACPKRQQHARVATRSLGACPSKATAKGGKRRQGKEREGTKGARNRAGWRKVRTWGRRGEESARERRRNGQAEDTRQSKEVKDSPGEWARCNKLEHSGRIQRQSTRAPWTGASRGPKRKERKGKEPGLEHPGNNEQASNRATGLEHPGCSGQKPWTGPSRDEARSPGLGNPGLHEGDETGQE